MKAIEIPCTHLFSAHNTTGKLRKGPISKHSRHPPNAIKNLASVCTALGWFISATSALAQPQGGQVTAGVANIQQTVVNGQVNTQITQSSMRVSLSWKSFNVGTNDVVNFVQPSKDALAINRINDVSGTKILGQVRANGQVWLINPNGVIFGKDAQINAAGLLATTLDNSSATPDNAALTGEQRFSGNSKAAVVNWGQINTDAGGYVALLGHSVSNLGAIQANQGSVVLGAGSNMRLRFADSRFVSIQVDQHLLDALANNGGLLQADGGQVILTAGARDSVLASAVNNTGVVQARTVERVEGKIVLQAGAKAGRLTLAGRLDASAPQQGSGGSIETSAASLHIDPSVQISTQSANGLTGEWKLDPTDFTIGRGNTVTSVNGIGGATLARMLEANNVTIETNNTSGTDAGDIFVNAPLSWSTPYQLSLKAYRHIYINDVITASHANGKLSLAVGQGSANGDINGTQARYWVNAPIYLKSGWNFFTQSGGGASTQSYYVITALGSPTSKTGTDLQGLDEGVNPQSNPSVQQRNYALGADIDASATKTWNSGAGFRALFQTNLTTDAISYQGTFDGLGHVITGLSINRPNTGVLSFITVLGAKGVIQNLGMKNVDYTTNNTGGIVFRNFGLIRNSFVDQGTITAGDGFKNKSNFIGGLVGHNLGQIVDSYANVTVAMPDNNASYTQALGYTYKVGGLVGVNSGGITDSYAAGKVYVSNRTVTNADGTVSPMFYAGGLIGQNTMDIATGLTGSASGSDWNAQAYASNQAPPAGMKAAVDGVGLRSGGASANLQIKALTETELKTAASFKDWDMHNAWLIYDGNTRPLLRAFMTPLHLSASATGEKTYDGNVNFNTWQVTLPAQTDHLLAGQASMVLNSPDAGTRQAVVSGHYSDQYGYQVSYDFSVNSVQVQQATLTLTAQSAAFYIGQPITNLTGAVTGLVANETLQTATTGQLQWVTNAKNALLPGNYAIEGVGIQSKNYALVQAVGNASALRLQALAPAPVLTKAVASNLQPQALPWAAKELNTRAVELVQTAEAEPVAGLFPDSPKTRKGASVFEFCLPKPPSMVSAVNVVCVRSQQR